MFGILRLCDGSGGVMEAFVGGKVFLGVARETLLSVVRFVTQRRQQAQVLALCPLQGAG